MNRRQLQIIAKIGLLLVVIGFFMPITCSLNGFEIAGEISDLGENDGVVILLYILFGSALVGGILLFLNRHSLGIDWTIFIVCVGSGLIAYSSVSEMAGKLQGGGYLIIIGWIVAGISLIVASTKPEGDQEGSNNSFHFKFPGSEVSQELKTTGEKPTIGHMSESRSGGETLGTFDFSKNVALDWPVELESGSLMKDPGSKDPEILTGKIEVRNVQSREILYMEWQLRCFDILNKPIFTDSPVVIRHEEHFSAKQTVTASTTGSLPSGTRSFTPYLKAVLYGDQEIEEFSDGIATASVGPKTEIKLINSYNARGLEAYQKKHGFKESPVYLYKKNDEGIWTCAFCGTRNKKGATECRLCSVETSQQELCSREVIEQSFENWKRLREEEAETERRQREEQEKKRLEQQALFEEERKKEEQSQELERKKSLAWLKKFIIVAVILTIVGCVGALVTLSVLKSQKYNRALSMMETGENDQAFRILRDFQDYKDAQKKTMELTKIEVTLDLMGGTTADGKSSLKIPFYNAPYTLPPNRYGYLFEGWYKERSLENRLDFPRERVNSEITLYAKWIALSVGGLGPAGGHIFYDNGSVSDGWRYMEAAPATREWSDAVWGGTGTRVRTTQTRIGTGKANTENIVAKYGQADPYQDKKNYAAKLCTDLVVTKDYVRYDDWFLPSKDELNLIYLNLSKKDLGGFSDETYWSSSEGDASGSWAQVFYNGDQGGDKKENGDRVRAVRVF